MSASTDVLGELASIIGLVTGLDATEVRPERAFVDDLRIDSLAMVEILEGAGVHFGVRIADEDAKYFVRVGDLAGYIGQRLG